MNSILIRSNNSTLNNNYKIVFIIIIFIVFKIFALGVYPVFSDNSSLYNVFVPLIFYFIYFIIDFMIFKLFNRNKEINNYSLLLSLIVAFIVPVNTPIYIFIFGSIISDFICYLLNNKINRVGVTYLLISIYLSFNNINIYDIYNYPFNIILLVMCLCSMIYLLSNNLIKWEVLIPLLIILLIYIYLFDFIDIHVMGIVIFSILFVACDNRFTPVRNCNMFIFAVLNSLLFLIFMYLKINYSLMLTMVFGNIISILLYYMDILLLEKKRIIKS